MKQITFWGAVCPFLLAFSRPLTAQAGTVKSEQPITEMVGGFGGDLTSGDQFGRGLATIGDLDNNGIVDLAVGTPFEGPVGHQAGGLWILFLNSDGTVASEQQISDAEGGFGGVLDDVDNFGYSIAELGDLDQDGIEDIAVGARFDDDNGQDQGAVWVLFLNIDGTVKAWQKISESSGGLGAILTPGERFATSLGFLGDLDGDGVGDLAVGSEHGSGTKGHVWILFLNTNGTVKAKQRITEGIGGFGGSLLGGARFGTALSCLGDLDRDGVVDVAVGSNGDSDGGTHSTGAVWIVFLNTDGTVKSEQKISATAGGFGGSLIGADYFGDSVTTLGDLSRDGIVEIAVGAPQVNGIDCRNKIWVLFLAEDGTVKGEQEISEVVGGFGGTLGCEGRFRSLANLGDLDGDGVCDFAVGDPIHAGRQGRAWILFLNAKRKTSTRRFLDMLRTAPLRSL